MSDGTGFASDVEVLFDAGAIARRVGELARRIEADYRDRDLVLIGVLKGSVIFLADLVRAIALPLDIDFLGVSSYGDATESSGVVRITSDLTKPIAGRDVLVVEDIVDTGLTMQFLLSHLASGAPASLAVCTLLHKPSRERARVSLDYVGFQIPDLFVVGYGLDAGGRYRNLPFIGHVRGPSL